MEPEVVLMVSVTVEPLEVEPQAAGAGGAGLQLGLPASIVVELDEPCATSVPLVQSWSCVTVVVVGCVPP